MKKGLIWACDIHLLIIINLRLNCVVFILCSSFWTSVICLLSRRIISPSDSYSLPDFTLRDVCNFCSFCVSPVFCCWLIVGLYKLDFNLSVNQRQYWHTCPYFYFAMLLCWKLSVGQWQFVHLQHVEFIFCVSFCGINRTSKYSNSSIKIADWHH